MVISYAVPGGRMEVQFPEDKFHGLVRTCFMDGAVAEFDPAKCDDQLAGAADELGYGNRKDLFGVHHEMTHNFVALALRWPCSTIVWQAAHNKKKPQDWKKGKVWPYSGWDEEHIVNKLLLHIQTGEEDNHGIVREVWGETISLLLSHLNSWLRPWIQAPIGDPPIPVSPRRVCYPMDDDRDWRECIK